MTRRGAAEAARLAAVRVRVPFRRPFATATGTFRQRDAWLLRVTDAGGRTGVGEACLDPAAGTGALDALAAAVRACVETGETPTGSGAFDLAVRAAIDGATADLALHDAPLAPTFVTVNATIATAGLDATLDAVQSALGRGFDCLKLKAGGEGTMEHFVERLTLVRALAGDDVELRIDANGAWDRETAVGWLAAVGNLGLTYAEQPVEPEDLEGLAWVRRRSAVGIAADESVRSPTDAKAVLAAEAADVLIVKPARVGGPGATLAIARDAGARDVGVTISTLLETGVGLAAALRCAAGLPGANEAWAHGLATSDVLAHDLLATPLEVRDGRVALPVGPLVLDDDAVGRYAVERVGW